MRDRFYFLSHSKWAPALFLCLSSKPCTSPLGPKFIQKRQERTSLMRPDRLSPQSHNSWYAGVWTPWAVTAYWHTQVSQCPMWGRWHFELSFTDEKIEVERCRILQFYRNWPKSSTVIWPWRLSLYVTNCLSAFVYNCGNSRAPQLQILQVRILTNWQMAAFW